MRTPFAPCILALATCSSAFAIRDGLLNATTLASRLLEPTQGQTETGEPDLRTVSRQFRPRPEVTVTGFEELPAATTAIRQNAPRPDLGAILESFLTMTSIAAVPSIHTEKSAPSFDDASKGPATQSNDNRPSMQTAPGQAVTAGSPQDNRPQATYSPVAVPQISSPPIAVTLDGVVFEPTPVTSASVITVDGKPITTPVVELHYRVGSSILPINSPMTVDNMPVAISIDAAGSTVLIAGSTATTLPVLAPNIQAAQVSSGVGPAQISTVVADGTTKYVLAGQTLAPGQAVTIGDVPISFTVKDGNTVLVMGSSTTTLTAPLSTTSDWETSKAPPGVVNGNGNNRPVTISSKAGADGMRRTHQLLAQLVGVAGVALPLM